jgi:hypothetical protein
VKNEIVMKESEMVRDKWLHLRLSEVEKSKLVGLQKRSGCNSLGEYARKVLLKEPVKIFYRNKTADEFLSQMILLKNELNAIGKNINQAVHKLHTFDHVADIKSWAIVNEASNNILFQKVNQIEEKLQQIYDLWSQK